jgi:LysM repeat protein
VSTPETNVEAGVAYLLMRAATSVVKSVPDPLDIKGSEITVKAGDSLEKIAKANSTTVDMLKALNPGAGAMIRPGQVLKSKKATMQRKISSWAQITTEFVARTYNTSDPLYKRKLDYCLSIMPK